MPFEFKRLEIQEIILIIPKIFEDSRGFFLETYKESEFKNNGIDVSFVQDNHSKSRKGVLRGLHYQLNPKAQGKLISVVKGSIFDVAVDIRKGSPYFGKYVSVKLSEENKQMLWAPPGFAHGFIALDDDTEVFYKTTEEYKPQFERCIRWNDPDIKIKWPISNPSLSNRDANQPSFKDAENNFVYGGNK